MYVERGENSDSVHGRKGLLGEGIQVNEVTTVSHNPHLLISHIVIVVVNPILKEHRVAMDTTYSPRSRYQLLSSLCSLPINATEGMNDSVL